MNTPAPTPEKYPAIRHSDSITAAGLQVLQFHFDRMCQNEPGTILGLDPEALHDMRVATRRLRAAMRIFADFYSQDWTLPLARGLKKTGKRLGTVRDWDVLLDNLAQDLIYLVPDQAEDLQFVWDAWTARRDADRQKMLTYLHAEPYAAFKHQFAQFLSTPIEMLVLAKTPATVHQSAPRPIQAALDAVFSRYQTMNAAACADLHRLRIDFKRLRYTLEFFYNPLGPQIANCIPLLESIQDHLGDINDTRVALAMLQQLPVEHSAQQAALTAYLALKQTQLDVYIESFPCQWQGFAGSTYLKQLSQAIQSF